ncbi:MAG: hypothetical protein HC896_11775 [Bacteroidales bacterium]|nr:hypothetical protein [Bacteroidales bacterium]
MLAKNIGEDLSVFKLQQQVLDHNWRSCQTIVDFNNMFFSRLVTDLKGHEDIEGYEGVVQDLYADIEQRLPAENTTKEGYVSLVPIDDEDWKPKALEHMLDSIKALQDSGLQPAGTAILVRKKTDAVLVSRFLQNEQVKPKNQRYNLSIVSAEALLLKSNIISDIYIAAFMLLENQDNNLAAYNLVYSYLELSGKANQQIFELNVNDLLAINLPEAFCHLLKSSYKTGMYDLAENIAIALGLNSFPEHAAYLTAFLDLVWEKSLKRGLGLSGFLSWWQENNGKITLPASSGANAMPLLTIHKSKGLQFDAVIIPFLDWEIKQVGQKAPILWDMPNEDFFADLPLLPVTSSANLLNTSFRATYKKELFCQYIDSVNLLYVAMTRAKTALLAWYPASAKKAT